jgi:hypothetical protein
MTNIIQAPIMKVNDKYIDWHPILNHITNSHELTILELGCGTGTAFLLDKFKFVYSYETNTRDNDGIWFKSSMNAYKDRNWQGFFDTSWPSVQKDVDITELITSISQCIDLDSIDVVFIDPGFKNRAECVLAFANTKKYKYIFTHDTNTQPQLYNWALLNDMPEYYTITATLEGQGTKLWKLND